MHAIIPDYWDNCIDFLGLFWPCKLIQSYDECKWMHFSQSCYSNARDTFGLTFFNQIKANLVLYYNVAHLKSVTHLNFPSCID